MHNESWLEKAAFEVSYAWREYVAYRIKMVRNHIKWAYQRLTRGFDDRATWNLDDYLSKHIAAVIMRYVEKADCEYPEEIKDAARLLLEYTKWDDDGFRLDLKDKSEWDKKMA